MYCRSCGQLNVDGARACDLCGATMAPIVTESSRVALGLRGSPPPPHTAVSGIAADIILCIVTLGIYNLFWNARQFRTLNAFLGEERFQLLEVAAAEHRDLRPLSRVHRVRHRQGDRGDPARGSDVPS